ncbi:hypothetical protein [Paenibacillus aceris]|uniref:DUF3153 domain-containing protein n=1 Tax=Paenibacillus aceris TaxID=869555 RepID=A0ABS4I0L7_9BACL|nr:hypothetical protein [Paenibacillus aceris]MBP1964462.1 hypothetical protein [Paenibacillus aceris]NHW35825.1 hypothetical protein [Paenibacillus aceris]
MGKESNHQRIIGRFRIFTLLLAWTLLQPQAVTAHNSSYGYSNVTLTEVGVRYELLLLPDEMQPVLNLDLDQDGTVTIEEANQKESELQNFVARWMSVKADNTELPPKLVSMEMTERGVGLQMIKLNLDYDFGKTVKEVAIKYDIFVTTESPTHHNFASIVSVDGSTREFVFDKDHQILKLRLNPNSPKEAVQRIIKFSPWILLILLVTTGAFVIVLGYLIRLRTKRRNR